MAGGDLRRRVLVALVGVPLAIVVVWQGGWFLGTAMSLAAGLGAREFFQLASTRGGRPLQLPGIAVAVALPLLPIFFPSYRALAPWGFGAGVVLTLVCLVGVVWLRGVEGAPLSAAAATVTGAFYTGGTLAFALLLHHLPEAATGSGNVALPGGYLVAFPIAVTWIADSASYFAGRKWGRKKLVPRVSPGKTVVGGVAGLVGATVAGAGFAALFLGPDRVPGVGILPAAVMGAVLGVGAQVGDMAESVLKREAGVKDSGALLPGHGGVLDRFDALFVTVPLGYVLLVLLARW